MKVLWQMVGENYKFIYYVGNDGTVIRKSQKTGKTYQCSVFMQEKSCGSRLAYVKVNSKTVNLATLVYRSFNRTGFDYKKYYLTYKDGNRKNCSFNNLVPVPRKHMESLKKATAKVCKRVVIKDFRQEPVVYPSVRAAAKALYCSYQTLLDYLGNVRKTSVLKKWGRKIYYLEEENGC